VVWAWQVIAGQIARDAAFRLFIEQLERQVVNPTATTVAAAG